jgi:hypothetical protein
MSKDEIVTIAKCVLHGEVDPLEGCRAIVRRQMALSESERHDPDFLVLVAIESETDHFPTEETRQYWDPVALAERDQERAAYLERNQKPLVDACRALVAKLSADAAS